MRPLALALLLLLLAPALAFAANDPRRGEQWNLDLIESDAAHAASTGAGAKRWVDRARSASARDPAFGGGPRCT